jgi:NAD(P)-dependent dehydrogenase (short-subunit alcohol dehydrogenase family)
MKLQDRVAIVTGGGAGIGRSVCVNMVKEGAKVIVADINQEAAQETADSIKKEGGDAMAIKTDVTQKSAVQTMAAEALKAYGKIDILVNNAGTDIKGAITELTERTWDTLMDINLKGVFLCTQAVSHSMIERRYGRIVNISSMAGKTGEPLTSPYCATA